MTGDPGTKHKTPAAPKSNGKNAPMLRDHFDWAIRDSGVNFKLFTNPKTLILHFE